MQTSGQGTTPIQVDEGSLLKQSELRRSFNPLNRMRSLEKSDLRPILETMRKCVFVIGEDKSFVLDGKGSWHFKTRQIVGGRTFQVVSRTYIECEWIWRWRVLPYVFLWCAVILTNTTRMPSCRLWTSPRQCLRAAPLSEFGTWWTKNSKQQKRAFSKMSEPKHRFTYHLLYPVDSFIHSFTHFPDNLPLNTRKLVTPPILSSTYQQFHRPQVKTRTMTSRKPFSSRTPCPPFSRPFAPTKRPMWREFSSTPSANPNKTFFF